jgi:hypoxia-inducible factor 1 alpha
MVSRSFYNTATKFARIRKLEKRKEESREAARYHRSQEVETFNDLANLLPVSSSLTFSWTSLPSWGWPLLFSKCSPYWTTVSSFLVWNVTSNYSVILFYRCTRTVRYVEWEPPFDGWCLLATSAMLLALSSKGDIVYLTENVTQELGLLQVHFYRFFCLMNKVMK